MDCKYSFSTTLACLICLERQEATRRNAEGRQLLRETVAVGIVQASAAVGEQLIQSLFQLSLVLESLRAKQMLLVLRKARFASQHETQHRPHHRPVVLWWSVQEQIEERGSQAREQIWLRCQVLVEVLHLDLVLALVAEVVGRHVIDRVRAKSADCRVTRLQPIVNSRHDLHEDIGVKSKCVTAMIPKQDLDKAVVGFAKLRIGIHVIQRDAESHSQGNVERIFQSTILVKIKHTKANVVTPESRVQYAQSESEPFVSLFVDPRVVAAQLGHGKEPSAISTNDVTGTAEQKDSVG